MTEPKQRGGARPGAGRKAEDGATNLVRMEVKVEANTLTLARQAGAAAIRKILRDGLAKLHNQ
jgi:hypothetical protein